MIKLQLLNKVDAFVREILGTLADIDGFKHADLDPTNWANEDKALMVDVFFKNGDIERMFCSKAVSAMVRNGEIKVNQLPLLPIALAERADNTTFYQLQRPTGERGKPFSITLDPKAKAFVPEKKSVNWEKLIALGV